MWNAHAQYIPNELKGAFKQHLQRVQPGALLVLDDAPFAVELKRALPKTTVVFRAWYPPADKDGDNSQHTRVKDPRDVLRMYESMIPTDAEIYFHYGNEPGASDELFDWSEAAARYTVERRRYGCYLNFSVGTPEPTDWRKPSAQRFLRTIALNPVRHVVGLHEYIPTLVYREFGMSADPTRWLAKVTGTSYLIGRYRNLLTTCDALGIRRPRIVLTEFGFDFIHAVQEWQLSLPKTDGDIGALWHNIAAWEQAKPPRMSWSQYMLEQLHWAWRALYRHDGIEGVCLYCFGSQGRWQSYDHMTIPYVFTLFESKDWRRMSAAQPQPTHWLKEVTWNTGMKFRAAPSLSASQLTLIPADTRVAVTGNPKVAEGYAWIPVTYNGTDGWSALGALGGG